MVDAEKGFIVLSDWHNTIAIDTTGKRKLFVDEVVDPQTESLVKDMALHSPKNESLYPFLNKVMEEVQDPPTDQQVLDWYDEFKSAQACQLLAAFSNVGSREEYDPLYRDLFCGFEILPTGVEGFKQVAELAPIVVVSSLTNAGQFLLGQTIKDSELKGSISGYINRPPGMNRLLYKEAVYAFYALKLGYTAIGVEDDPYLANRLSQFCEIMFYTGNEKDAKVRLEELRQDVYLNHNIQPESNFRSVKDYIETCTFNNSTWYGGSPLTDYHKRWRNRPAALLDTSGANIRLRYMLRNGRPEFI